MRNIEKSLAWKYTNVHYFYSCIQNNVMFPLLLMLLYHIKISFICSDIHSFLFKNSIYGFIFIRKLPWHRIFSWVICFSSIGFVIFLPAVKRPGNTYVEIQTTMIYWGNQILRGRVFQVLTTVYCKYNLWISVRFKSCN